MRRTAHVSPLRLVRSRTLVFTFQMDTVYIDFDIDKFPPSLLSQKVIVLQALSVTLTVVGNRKSFAVSDYHSIR